MISSILKKSAQQDLLQEVKNVGNEGESCNE